MPIHSFIITPVLVWVPRVILRNIFTNPTFWIIFFYFCPRFYEDHNPVNVIILNSQPTVQMSRSMLQRNLPTNISDSFSR